MPGDFRQRRTERRGAFEQVTATYEARLLRYAARLTGNPTAAEDVVQNTLIKLIQRWREALEPSPQLGAWLYRVVHNEAVDHVRREVRRQATHARQALEQEPYASEPEADASKPDRAMAAGRALQHLSPRERELVVLKVYEQKSYKEISAITGLTVGNVGYILHHAMRKLAACLDTGTAHDESE